MGRLRGKRWSPGFSLAEVLVTVTIIGVLTAIAIPVYTNQKRQAVIATLKSDAQVNAGEIVAALSEYTSNGAQAAGFSATTSGATMTITLGTGFAPGSLPPTQSVKVSLSSGNQLTGALKVSTTGFCLRATNGSSVVVYDETGLRDGLTACSATGVAS